MLKFIFTLLVVVAVASAKQSGEQHGHKKFFKKSDFKSHVQHGKHLDEFQRFNPNNLFALFTDNKLSNNQTAFLIVLNERVNDLMSISSTAGTVYLWDVLYPKLRVRLLKSVNYTLTINESLNWMSLPVNVQNELLDLKFNFSKNHKLDNISAEILVILEEVRFDLLISVDLLKEKISSIIFERIDQVLAYLQSSTYGQSQSQHLRYRRASSKQSGKGKSNSVKLKEHDSDEQSAEVTSSDLELRSKRSAESAESEESNENSDESVDEDEELRRKRSADSEESEESNENSDEDEDEYMEWRRKRASGNINKDKSEQHGKEHKASNQKKEHVKKSKHEKKTNEHHVEARAAGEHGKALEHANEHAKSHIGGQNKHHVEARAAEVETEQNGKGHKANHQKKDHVKKSKHEKKTNEHHVKARAAGQHGKALEHANEHAKSHIGGQSGHAKALEHANEHAKDHIGGHHVKARAAEEENEEEEETHNKNQKGAKHQKKEHTKKDKHEKKTHKNEQQDKDVLAAAHGKALEHQHKVKSAYKGHKTHSTKTVNRTTSKV